MRQIADTDLHVHPLCLGGNVFGWTADREQSFAVLDAYAQAGGNFIDTADVYSAWAEGNSGGESERIIGEWMAARGNRAEIVVATKVGMLGSRSGLSAANLKTAVADSLERLQTDYIDLYYAHRDDEQTPLEETLAAFAELQQAGHVRHVAASNYTPERLTQALSLADAGHARYVALQPHYNLVEREKYEGPLQAAVAAGGLSCIPYYALASGFLSGKYRAGSPEVDSPRAGGAQRYAAPRGDRVLEALEATADELGGSIAGVALSWLAAQPTVASVIASARTPEQLTQLLEVNSLTLSAEQLQRITAASA